MLGILSIYITNLSLRQIYCLFIFNTYCNILFQQKLKEVNMDDDDDRMWMMMMDMDMDMDVDDDDDMDVMMTWHGCGEDGVLGNVE